MINPTLVFTLLCFSVVLNSACQTTAESNNSTNKPSNTNAVNTTEAKPETTPAQQETSKPAGSLATPSDAYRTAFELRQKKDIEGLKKIMSKDIKDFLTMIGEEEKKSLDDVLKEMVETPQAPKAEVRNEKIDGDFATVEYLTETGSWKTMDFEKIGSDWFLTFPKGSKDDLKSTSKP